MLPAIRRDPLGVFLRMRADYGDAVPFRLAGRPAVLVSDPDLIRHVLQDNYRAYHKSPLYERLRPLLGNGLLLSEDRFWLRQRRLIQPAFHRQRVAALTGVMAEATAETIAHWQTSAESGQALDIAREMLHLTQRIILRTMFSANLGDLDSLEQVWPLVNEHIGTSFWSLGLADRLPTPRTRAFRRALRELDDVVARIIDTRRGRSDDSGDLLSMLLAAVDEDTGARMDGRELRDEVMTIFLAGPDTTALALAWTWYLLSAHPGVDQRVATEAREVLGGRPPAADDLERLPYTRMVIEEALRLYPPAWGFSRLALTEDRLGDCPVPRGAIVFVIPYVIHRHPAFWDEPEAFRPERFAPEPSKARPRLAYVPFGAGPRQCVGNHFAMLEAQLIVTTIVQRYRLVLVPGHPVDPLPLITLKPRHGMRMTIEARQPDNPIARSPDNPIARSSITQ
jgi:cytochrome P450